MWLWIVYALIGLVFGWLVTWVSECGNRTVVVLAGLAGSLAAGAVFQLLGGLTGLAMTYASLFVCMIGASVVAWLPTHHRLWSDAMEYSESFHHETPSRGA